MKDFCGRIAKERNCTPELVRAITTECLAELHEASFKGGVGTALFDAYWELGRLGAWHFCGLLMDAAEVGEPGEIAEHYQRMDPSLKQFARIAEQWQEEVEQGRDAGEEQRQAKQKEAKR